MPDIAMCANSMCPKKEHCYRYKAEPKRYQSYASFKYVMTDNGAICDGFAPIYTDHRSTGKC